MRLRSTLSLSLFAALVAAGCASTGSGDAASSGAAPKPAASSTAKQASVKLAPASGSLASGMLTLKPMGDGVHTTGETGGLPAVGSLLEPTKTGMSLRTAGSSVAGCSTFAPKVAISAASSKAITSIRFAAETTRGSVV